MERPFEPGELYGEPAFADVTIKYANREVKAHKVILSMRSKYFERAFAEDGGFKESTEGVLELHDDNPKALESLLRYIYTSQYPTFRPAEWKKHLELAIVADKYGLVFLKDLALDGLECIPTFAHTLKILAFITAVSENFPGEPERVGKLIMKHCDVRFKACFKNEGFRQMLAQNVSIRDELCLKHISELVGVPEFTAMLEEDNKLAAKYLERLVRLHKDHHLDCDGCLLEIDDAEESEDEETAESAEEE